MRLLQAFTVACLCAIAIAIPIPAHAQSDGRMDNELALVRLIESNVELRGQVSSLTRSIDELRGEVRQLRAAIDPQGESPQKESTPKAVATSSDLRNAIRQYAASGGQKWYVRDKQDFQHLIEDHGWSAEQISGLSASELKLLHGASHTGRLSPSSFGPLKSGRAAQSQVVAHQSRRFIAPPLSYTWQRSGCPNGMCPRQIRWVRDSD